jgi:methionine--tRNA ligase beta chain
LIRTKEEEAADAWARWEKAKEHPKMGEQNEMGALQKLLDEGGPIAIGVGSTEEESLADYRAKETALAQKAAFDSGQTQPSAAPAFERGTGAMPPPGALEHLAASGFPSAPSYITIEDLDKVEIRLGSVVAAEAVKKSKLLKLTVDFGEAAPRTVLAGVAVSFTPEHLVGKQFAFVTNLTPREMKGIVSQAMILAAGDPASLSLCQVLPPGVPGARFH